MNNFNATWDFHGLPPPPPPSPPHPFNTLPAELQDAIYEVATDPDQPQIRFVNFREHRTHHCPPFSINCGCQNARYLTFHPLRRQDVANKASWRHIVHAIESSAPDVHVASINHQSRDATDRLIASNRFPHQQGNWTLTNVPAMTSAERVARRHTPKTFIGDPTRCRTQDLVLVHFPDDQSLTFPHGFVSKQMFFDPVCGELEAMAVTMDNWLDQSYSHYLGEFLKRMIHHENRSWELLERYGARNVANGNFPADWQSMQSGGNYAPWYPELPQRKFDYDNNGGISNMRILHDIFTGLKELWFLDFDALHPDLDLNAVQRYRNTYKPRVDCQKCKYIHEGFPRVFGGVDAFDFMELRICDTGFNKPFVIRHDPQDFLDTRRQMEREWPHRDCHDMPWFRSKPVAKLLVPIPKML